MSAVPSLQRFRSRNGWYVMFFCFALLSLTTAHRGLAQEYAGAPPAPTPPFSRIGFDAHVGLGGVGVDIGTPLSQHLNLRAGSDFFRYATNFVDQGVSLGLTIRMQSSHAALDWFPWNGRFRISPLLVFSNTNHLGTTASVPGGFEMDMNGSNYVSSNSDPLRGSATVDFRRVAPGVTLGFGNLVPRSTLTHRPHFSFPSEVGFYYVGQPTLKVGFSGSACIPGYPQSIGCESASHNAEFLQSVAAFQARNERNLRYASFFPVFSAGIGYAF